MAVGAAKGCVVHGTRISSGGGALAFAEGAACWISMRMASGTLTALLLELEVEEEVDAALVCHVSCHVVPS